MVITIDGPAAAGKSTVARKLAARVGFEYLDTGAMYRTVTLKALETGLVKADACELAALARSLNIEFVPQGSGSPKVLCNGCDVTGDIRTPEVTGNIYRIADEPAVRSVLNEKQRAYARNRNIVTEGRDQGSVVFPDADLKFYLDASSVVRAKRRLGEYRAAGSGLGLDDVIREVHLRDRQDKSRPVGALVTPKGAVIVDTSELGVDEVVHVLADQVRNVLSEQGPD